MKKETPKNLSPQVPAVDPLFPSFGPDYNWLTLPLAGSEIVIAFYAQQSVVNPGVAPVFD